VIGGGETEKKSRKGIYSEESPAPLMAISLKEKGRKERVTIKVVTWHDFPWDDGGLSKTTREDRGKRGIYSKGRRSWRVRERKQKIQQSSMGPPQ